jgi:hypothetical protein
MNRDALLFVALMWVLPLSAADDKPRLPYYDWDACPFECCTYQKWEAKEAVDVFAKRSTKSAVVFRVKKGEWVQGVTGVVITYRAGLSKVLKPVEVGFAKDGDKPLLSLKPGELLYPLHYEGEGSSLFWYNGHVYSDGIGGFKKDEDPVPPDLDIQTLEVPEYV